MIIYPIQAKNERKYTKNVNKAWAIIPTECRFKELVRLEIDHRKNYDEFISDKNDDDDETERVDVFDFKVENEYDSDNDETDLEVEDGWGCVISVPE